MSERSPAQRQSESSLDERAQALLKVLIQRYIADAQPVGSKTLAAASGSSLSPATIRNVMADLEAQGFVTSPHTSAGRIPTAKGYRMFVDSLLSYEPLELSQLDRIREELPKNRDPSRIIASASDLISQVTSMAGLVSLPRHEITTLKHIEFLPLADQRILVVLVINNNEVQNRVIELDEPVDLSVLQQTANYLNQQFTGQDLSSIRRHLLREMEAARESMNDMMRQAIKLADAAIDEVEQPGDPEYVLAGQGNLLNFEELCDVARLRDLFDVLGQRRAMLGLVDRCMASEGVHIFIGEESGYSVFDDCSVVTAPYEAEGEVLGVLAVIGPSRMAYDRVVPVVDATAKILGSALAR